MASAPQILHVFFNQQAMGTLSRSKGGKLSFEYDTQYSDDGGAVPLSLSMPLTKQRHIEKMARASEFPAKEALGILSKMAEHLPEAAQKVANEMSDQKVDHPVIGELVGLLEQRAEHVAKSLKL